jgi:EmrB/QacA subfamily drug resistance transporter
MNLLAARRALTPSLETIPTRSYLIFGLVAMALLLNSVDNTIISVALPAVQHGLGTNLLLAGWTITSFRLGQLLVMPVAGKLSDDFGRKRLFLVGIALFTGASALCGLAPNIGVLIVCRFLQAIGGGTILPSCTGIVADAFPNHRAKAVGLFSSIFPIGGVIGPNLGGVIVDHLSWRFIFYVNVPIGIAVLVLSWWLYHPGREERGKRRIDFLGVAIYAAALATILIDMSWIGERPRDALASPLLWASLIASAALFVVWYKHEKRTDVPMMEIDLLKQRPFFAANAYAFLWGAGVFGFTAFLPTYVQLHYNMSATAAGALLTPRSIIMILTSTAASLLLIRFGYRLPMIAGILMVSISLALTGLGPLHPSIFGLQIAPFLYMTVVIGILGLGFGFSGPASNNAALDLAPDKIASITGIRALFRQTGGTIGTGATIVVFALYPNPAHGLQIMFVLMSLVMLTVIPWVFMIPDTARQIRRGKGGQADLPEPVVASAEAK